MKDGFNDFTNDCNKYLIDDYKVDEYNIGTYLYNNGYIETMRVKSPDLENISEKCFVVFRVPGASRGIIAIDGNTMIIKDIIFYDQCCFDYSKGIGCYKKEILELREKYVGTIYSN